MTLTPPKPAPLEPEYRTEGDTSGGKPRAPVPEACDKCNPSSERIEAAKAKQKAKTICNDCEHVRRSLFYIQAQPIALQPDESFACGSAGAKANNDKTSLITGLLWCKDVNDGACPWFEKRKPRPDPEPRLTLLRRLWRWGR